MAKKINNSSIFTCCGKEMIYGELSKHLKTAHQIDIKKTKFKQEMIAHMDGREWFGTKYKLTAENGIEIIHDIYCVRAKDDMMRFA